MRWLDGITDSMGMKSHWDWNPGVGDGQGGLLLQCMGSKRDGHDCPSEELIWTFVGKVISLLFNMLSSWCHVIIKLWNWVKVKFLPSWGLLQVSLCFHPFFFYWLSQPCWGRGRKGGEEKQGCFWILALVVASLGVSIDWLLEDCHCGGHSISSFLIKVDELSLDLSLMLFLALGNFVICLHVLSAGVLLSLVLYKIQP